jgi:hypothetical protein
MNSNSANREEIVRVVKDFYDKVTFWIRKNWNNHKANSFEETDEYTKAMVFFESFLHKDGVDYSLVTTYQRELYSRLCDTDKILDEKADTIIKYLGGGVALIAFGALVSIKPEGRQAIIGAVAIFCLLPSLILSSLAVRRAVSVRRPQPSTLLPDVSFPIKCVEEYGAKYAEVNIWMIFHPMCEAALYRNIEKSKLETLTELAPGPPFG